MSLSVVINIKRPFIVLSGSNSTSDIQQKGSNTFGIVEQTYAYCDVISVGNSVLFNYNDAEKFSISNNEYYLISEDKILFSEPPSIII